MIDKRFKLVHEEDSGLDIEQRRVLVDGEAVLSVFVNQITNYYGTLVCFQVDGKYYMGIEDYDGNDTAVCVTEELALSLAELSTKAVGESVKFKTDRDWVDEDE